MNRPFIIAGPCSAESLAQLREIAQALSRLGVDFFRAGAWKPRTHPNDFEGCGTEALEWLSQIQAEFQLPVATEVATALHVEAVLKAGLKGIWVGARTTVNPFAVQEIASALAGTEIKVFVKNPVNPDAALWMGAIERFQRAGVVDPVAIHRGFSVYKYGGYRNAPIWMVPMEVKRSMPHISILCDPSHIAGNSRWVPSLAQKAMDLCFDGLMIEVHPHPHEALSDSQQQLTPSQFEQLIHTLVLRSPDAPNHSIKNKLEDLRTQIDLCDDHIVEALAQRMRVVAEIGSVKRAGGITIFQQRRWEGLIARIRQQGDLSGISTLFLEQLFALIHQEAVMCQQGIMQAGEEEEERGLAEEERANAELMRKTEGRDGGKTHDGGGGNKEVGGKETSGKEVNDRETGSKETNSKETNNGGTNSKEANSEHLNVETKPFVRQLEFRCTKPQLCPIDHLPEHLMGKRAILLVDRKVNELYYDRLPPLPRIVIEANERLKRLETVQEVIQKLMTLEADRTTWLVGVGGGIVCDITGFVASIYMRGIPFVLVPTTLLAQTDAAIGGKNGVNVNGIKNMAGCIMQPQSILYDPQLLHTLPQKEIRSGLGEVIKHALIGSPALLNYIEQHTQSILALQPETIHYLLAASHRLKCGIVERDEREQGLRRILNFGHTVGHAIEAVQQHQVEARNKNIINILNNDTAIITTQNIKEASVSQSNENYTHGEAVAVGILYAVALSIRYAHVDRSLLPRLKRLYTQCTLPTTLPCSLDDLCNAMLLDKKRTDTSIRFILLKELGAPFPYQISIDEVAEALKLAHGNIAF